MEKLWQLLCSIFCLLIYPLHAYVPLIPAAVGAWLQNGAVAGTRQRPMPATAYGNGSYQNNQDADGVSTSGDGSNLADELDDCSDRELDRFSGIILCFSPFFNL